MTVNGKKLAAALARELKAGYDVCITPEMLHIKAGYWTFSTEFEAAGNELLGELTRQIGILPPRLCARIFLGKTEQGKQVFVQQLLSDAFFADREEWELGDAGEASFTGLRLGSDLLYQTREGQILAAHVASALLADSPRRGLVRGGVSISWEDGESAVRFQAWRPDEGSPLRPRWEALESVTWTDREE